MISSACQTQVQLVAHESLWLDMMSECTFFQQDFPRYTPFAIGESDIASNSAPRWGTQLNFEVPRAADLLAATLLKIYRQGLRFGFTDVVSGVDVPDWTIEFVQASGYAAINRTCLEIGNISVDYMSGEFLEIFEQARSPVGNEQGPMIGEFATEAERRDWSFNSQYMYIALQFFFFEHPEMYLPLIALSAHSVKIKVWLNNLNQIVNAYDTATGTAIQYNGPTFAGLSTNLDTTFDGSIIDAQLTARYVFLDQFERNLVSAEIHEIVFLQHQEDNSETVQAGATNKTVILSFNNAVTCLFMRERPDSYTDTTNYGAKDFFDYTVPRSGHLTSAAKLGATGASAGWGEQPPWDVGTDLRVSPISQWQLQFNGIDRVTLREIEYFTNVIPFLHLVKKSRSQATLSYSFAIRPVDNYQTPNG